MTTEDPTFLSQVVPSRRLRGLLAAAGRRHLLGPGLHQGGIPAGSTCWPGMLGRRVRVGEPNGLFHLAKVGNGAYYLLLHRSRHHHRLLAASSSLAAQSLRVKSLVNQERPELRVYEGSSLTCLLGRIPILLASHPFGSHLLA